MNKKLNLIVAGAILIAGILVGGFLILSSKPGLAELSQGITKFFKGDQPQDPKLVDSDKDGLTDWQEEIYKTDPNNPDTDNDTYLDGEEVMSGYDPLIPAPDDKLSDKAINPRPKPGSMSGINLTEELGKMILENIKNDPHAALTDEAGMDLQATDLVNNALAAALVKSPNLNLIPTISDSDIKISQETSREAEESYTNQIASIISEKAGFQKSVLEVAEEAMQTKDYSGLDKYIKGYTESYLAAKEVVAPIRWKEIHKKNLALLVGSANIFETFKLIDQDPLRATIALQQYQTILSEYKTMLEEMLELIKSHSPTTP